MEEMEGDVIGADIDRPASFPVSPTRLIGWLEEKSKLVRTKGEGYVIMTAMTSRHFNE